MAVTERPFFHKIFQLIQLTVSLTLLLFSSQISAFDIKVMAYNVQNLFDTKHDIDTETKKDKNDYTYLPLSEFKIKACKKISSRYRRHECLNTDWTKEKLQWKIDNITKLVKKINPDILALTEVENKQVLLQLAKKLDFKYFVITQGPDFRGIDVALLFKDNKNLTYVKSFEHKLQGDIFTKHPTRNILEVQFDFSYEHARNSHQSKLTIFVNHWASPSPRNPVKMRVLAAKKMKSIIEKRLAKNQNEHFLAVGDFNTLETDAPVHPFYHILYKKPHPLFDVHIERNKNSTWTEFNEPLGTYFYRPHQSWNRLDRIFVTSNLINGEGLEVDLLSYRIYSSSTVSKPFTLDDGNITYIPYAYNHQTNIQENVGYSDHFPIYINLQYVP